VVVVSNVVVLLVEAVVENVVVIPDAVVRDV
jgi:hypothetical protein